MLDKIGKISLRFTFVVSASYVGCLLFDIFWHEKGTVKLVTKWKKNPPK